MTGKIIGPILLIVLLVIVVSSMSAISLKGKKEVYQPGVNRDYGPLGGAVCKHCGRPFARHIWGINMVIGKFDRCPYCGKWSVVQRAAPSVLLAAEMAQVNQSSENDITKMDEKDQTKKDLDDSRYTDL